MRKGEMLRVQLKQIPITPRLLKLLKKRRFIGPDGHVFGDADGGLVEDIKKP